MAWPARQHPMKRTRLNRMSKKVARDRVARLRRLVGDITAPAKEGSRKDLEDKLERLNAKYVKMRDGYQCQQCAADNVPTEAPLDAGHIYPKGLYPGGKFLVENILAQCRQHNLLHINRPELLMTFYQQLHGEDALIALHEKVLAMPRKMSTDWLQEQIAEREQQIAELECHLSAMV